MRLIQSLCLAGLLTGAALAAAQENNLTGEALFKKQCAGCHGPNGSGQTAMGRTFHLRDLRSQDVQNMTDPQISDVIGKGRNKMPAYGGKLSKNQISSLVGYIRDLAKAK